MSVFQSGVFQSNVFQIDTGPEFEKPGTANLIRLNQVIIRRRQKLK